MAAENEMYVVGFDGSEASERAADFAADAALAAGARLHFIYVIEGRGQSGKIDAQAAEDPNVDKATRIVGPALIRYRQRGLDVSQEIRRGKPGDAIKEAVVENDAAHVFIGRKATPTLADRLLGGVAASLMQNSPVAVTVVP